MLVKENYSLRSSNSFGVAANARYFTEVISQEEIREMFAYKRFQGVDKLWLGGGSNILFITPSNNNVNLNKEILDFNKEYSIKEYKAILEKYNAKTGYPKIN